MSTGPDPEERSALFVIVWRDLASPRLRTYTHPVSNRPLALPLSDFSHPPTTVITTPHHLRYWRESPLAPAPFPDPAVAISLPLAESELGWDPLPAPKPEGAPAS